MGNGSANAMKVLLLEPLIGSIVFPGMARFNVAYPLLAAMLRNNGIEVAILDPNAEDLDWKGLEAAIRDAAPDVVAIGCNPTAMANRAIENIEFVKEINKDITTVAGGVFFGLNSTDILKKCAALDFVVTGEGEYALPELVRELEKKKPNFGKVKGIAFREGDDIITTPPRPPIADMDTLPLPAYVLAPLSKLKSFFWFDKVPEDYMIMVSSRGCAWSCTFCSQWKFYSKKWRAFSARRVVDEIELLHKQYGKSYFVFGDDLFNFDKKRVSDIADGILDRGLKIKYSIEARIDLLLRDRDILGKMVKSGLNHVIFGFDAMATNEALQEVRKGITLDQIRAGVAMLKQYPEVATHCFMVVGSRKDSRESIKATVEFLKEICPDVVFFWLLTPFPGTELWETARENGWIEEPDLSKYDEVHPIMPTETLSRKELRELVVSCNREYYGSAQFFEKLKDPNKRNFAGFFYDAWIVNKWSTPDLYKAFGASVREQMKEDFL